MEGKDVLKRIKSRGYWKVNFRPEKFDPALIPSLSTCKEVMQQSFVLLRGWDYPHVPRSNDKKQELYYVADKVESWIDWEQMKEFWRFHQSGQFIHLCGMFDDWDEDRHLFADPQRRLIPPLQELDAIEILYRCTEILLFVRNVLGSESYPSKSLILDISLHGTSGRRLVVRDPGRVPLFGEYMCKADEVIFPSKVLSVNHSHEAFEEMAVDITSYIVSQFQWDTFSKDSFRGEQKKLIERRI